MRDSISIETWISALQSVLKSPKLMWARILGGAVLGADVGVVPLATVRVPDVGLFLVPSWAATPGFFGVLCADGVDMMRRYDWYRWLYIMA